jgi:SAM-dependent methyltransferase
MPPPPNHADPYFLGYRQAEQDRLGRQAQELAADSNWLFDQLGALAGWRVIEIGCGPQGCLGLLAGRVGAAGRVVGVERSAEQVQRARGFVADGHLANVEVIHADGRATGLPGQSFDLATARLVLVNVPQPEGLVQEMVRLVRPGGLVALHEAESTTQRCDPPHPAQARLLEVLNASAAMDGIDRTIGSKVPRLMREAGLVDIQVQPCVHAYPLGHGRRMLLFDFVENARSRVLDQQLATEAELNELTAHLRRHLEDPETLVLSSVFVQAWGRTPERP